MPRVIILNANSLENLCLSNISLNFDKWWQKYHQSCKGTDTLDRLVISPFSCLSTYKILSWYCLGPIRGNKGARANKPCLPTYLIYLPMFQNLQELNIPSSNAGDSCLHVLGQFCKQLRYLSSINNTCCAVQFFLTNQLLISKVFECWKLPSCDRWWHKRIVSQYWQSRDERWKSWAV